MDPSSMSSMAGMSSMSGVGVDTGSAGMFRPYNQMLARTYWYLAAAIFALVCLMNGTRAFEAWSRKRTSRTLSIPHPTRPQNLVSQSYATTVAIWREISYPQVIHFSRPCWTWLSPPPLGRSLVVLTYWVIMTLLLTWGSIIHDAYYWERIGFRAAWVSVTQVPLIFLLAGKVNIASFLLGSSSYMDVNWLHSWVSRTLFVTVTIHGSFFIREWIRADFFTLELKMMPMVKYGLSLWGVLAWTTVSSLVPLRRLCYEFFVLQHVVSAAVFLWLLHVHVPAYAAYNVWMAVAFVLLGRVFQLFVFLYRNVGVCSKNSTKKIGYLAKLYALGGDITLVTIHDVDFSWKAGQHVLVSCPTLGPLESHPFTISNVPWKDRDNAPKRVELVIRARSGFTRRIYQRALSSQDTSATATVFVTGPFGNLPIWNTYETLVLISASTGASFTLPILESVLSDPCCVSRIDCLLLVRHKSHIEGYLSRLLVVASKSTTSRVSLQIKIAVTSKGADVVCGDDAAMEVGSLSNSSSSETPSKALLPQARPKETFPSNVRTVAVEPKQERSVESEEQNIGVSIEGKSNEKGGSLQYILGRPRLAVTIREPVEASAGETSVIVCGGKSLTSTVRDCVASLSDERAVHKGTGAQGIHLHVEEFGL